jgi:uncharacterized DUF497 family protein
VKYFDWNDEKNELLLERRGVTFEDVVMAIESCNLLDRMRHPNLKKYPNQFVLYVNIGGYVYSVPCVEDESKVFLKTIIPDRKATKHYLKGQDYEEK